MNKCRRCSKEFKYSKDLRKKGYRSNLCNSCSVTESRQKLKQKLVEYKGGSCEICGYNKTVWALDFHHLDPNKKDFGIDSKIAGLEKMKVEVDKCILVCANCHREIHANISGT